MGGGKKGKRENASSAGESEKRRRLEYPREKDHLWGLKKKVEKEKKGTPSEKAFEEEGGSAMPGGASSWRQVRGKVISMQKWRRGGKNALRLGREERES